jgi:hypothetical protein
MKKKGWIIAILVIIGAIAAAGGLMKGHMAVRCDYDGKRIQPIYEVDFEFEDGSMKRFCCIVCALMDLKDEEKKLKYITVVDEVSGKKIDDSLASFVESDVITIPHVKNRIHVFAEKSDAERHAHQFNGKLILNPFRQAMAK